MTSTGEGCSHAVVTYSWEGTPHPITVTVPSSLPARQRPYGARSWEAADIDLSQDEGIMHRGQPLLSRVAVDFSTACKVLLGAVEIAEHSSHFVFLPILLITCSSIIPFPTKMNANPL
ncbi:hypothetical protein OESDEN_23042 [Oesophagostomum dentatum]|uniref:Uncharacterized protein n=1 Tax=Oesophagostomum dentatum TaxID=61180 RepID=A0A0B1RW88_OESDE|nr:hypothetical protein OESDEN_23042 [Oesophagostomum dentatum]